MLTATVLLLLAAFLGWLVTGAMEGYMDAQKRPTEPMEWCRQHGFFRKKHVLQFGEVTVCPRCYQDAWNKVEK